MIYTYANVRTLLLVGAEMSGCGEIFGKTRLVRMIYSHSWPLLSPQYQRKWIFIRVIDDSKSKYWNPAYCFINMHNDCPLVVGAQLLQFHFLRQVMYRWQQTAVALLTSCEASGGRKLSFNKTHVFLFLSCVLVWITETSDAETSSFSPMWWKKPS